MSIVSRVVKTGIGWATGGSLWPLAIAGVIGLAAGIGGTAWVTSFIVEGAQTTAAAQTERADNLGKLLATRNIEIADRDAKINSLSADIDRITVQAGIDQAAALKIVKATTTRNAELENALGKARKTKNDEALHAGARSALVWLRCWQRADPADVHASARCSSEAGLPAD